MYATQIQMTKLMEPREIKRTMTTFFITLCSLCASDGLNAPASVFTCCLQACVCVCIFVCILHNTSRRPASVKIRPVSLYQTAGKKINLNFQHDRAATDKDLFLFLRMHKTPAI